MNTDDITIGQFKMLRELFFGTSTPNKTTFDNGMIGQYVIVRCRDAGVHAGVLESHSGRECVLRDSRRLWSWKPRKNKTFLSGVAVTGLHDGSKVGTTLPKIHLTEDCEIIQCTVEAENSIRNIADHESKD